VRFEWGTAKAEANLAKHGVSFHEASSVFGDPLATTVRDDEHSTEDEERLLTTGVSNRGRVVIVWHVESAEGIRIIGARGATSNERRVYESGE